MTSSGERRKADEKHQKLEVDPSPAKRKRSASPSIPIPQAPLPPLFPSIPRNVCAFFDPALPSPLVPKPRTDLSVDAFVGAPKKKLTQSDVDDHIVVLKVMSEFQHSWTETVVKSAPEFVPVKSFELARLVDSGLVIEGITPDSVVLRTTAPMGDRAEVKLAAKFDLFVKGATNPETGEVMGRWIPKPNQQTIDECLGGLTDVGLLVVFTGEVGIQQRPFGITIVDHSNDLKPVRAVLRPAPASEWKIYHKKDEPVVAVVHQQPKDKLFHKTLTALQLVEWFDNPATFAGVEPVIHVGDKSFDWYYVEKAVEADEKSRAKLIGRCIAEAKDMGFAGSHHTPFGGQEKKPLTPEQQKTGTVRAVVRHLHLDTATVRFVTQFGFLVQDAKDSGSGRYRIVWSL